MSDSGDDAARPSDHAIEQALRSIVRDALKNDEEVTIKIARTWAEEQLGLGDGFFKNDSEWKARSKTVIEEAVEEPASPEQPNKAAPKPKAGAKRKSDEAEDPVKKRRKQAAIPDSEDVEPEIELEEDADKGLSEPEDVVAKTKALPKSVSTSALSSPPAEGEDEREPEQNGKATATSKQDDDSDFSSVVDDAPPKKKRQPKAKATTTKAKPTKAAKPTKSKKEPSPDVEDTKPQDDESDLSSVLDDPPPKKKVVRKSSSATSKSKPAVAAKPTKELSSDEEEIKRLQSWLLKCGVRKLWHRELAPFSTPKEKIKHLKGMLEEVGLTGRYSAEKAKAIKESRELKAELEAVEEYAQQWGKEKGEDEDEDDEGGGEEGNGGPKKVAGAGRLKPRGLVDFGDSGEDSD